VTILQKVASSTAITTHMHISSTHFS